ncbi:MAG: MBL fold metallo-hydrolase [Planctomycetes bacterium]|nr:MBL fold metallo-hydrolase [Planctomycetota bacterium]
MRLLITGIGDAFTSRHFGSSAVLDAPEGYVLIDCPDLINRALREAKEASGWPVEVRAIDDIILTHLHGDHCNGLEAFGFLRRIFGQNDPAQRPRIHTTAPVAERLWERLAPAMDAPFTDAENSTLEDYYDVRIIEPGTPASIAGLTVESRFTKHPVPTIGLRVSNGEVTLGWSGDTAYDPRHIEWLSDADLIVHEVNISNVHTPISSLNALPDELRARIRLNHIVDDFDPACTDMRVLAEGEVVEVVKR